MSAFLRDKPRVAIAGATGAVGKEILALLEQGRMQPDSLVLLASERSVGRELRFRGQRVPVRSLAEDALAGVDLAFFSCGRERSLEFVPAAVKHGALVVDNSSAFRLDPEVPLVVPEVNAHSLFAPDGSPAARIIANPNCSTILLVVVLAPLLAAFGLRRVVVATYQAASGAGQRGMDTLLGDSESRFSGTPGTASAEVFGHPLAFNLVPQVDRFLDDGATGEENKMVLESRKILVQPELAMDATCVRVPVLRCHCESVTVETRKPVSPGEARELLASAPGIRVVDDPARRVYPMPIDAEGEEAVLVGRLRPSGVFRNGLSFWLCGDQLLKGAALNAVQIVEALVRRASVPAPER